MNLVKILIPPHTDESLQPYLNQIDQIESSIGTLEQTAYKLDSYTKQLGELIDSDTCYFYSSLINVKIQSVKHAYILLRILPKSIGEMMSILIEFKPVASPHQRPPSPHQRPPSPHQRRLELVLSLQLLSLGRNSINFSPHE